MKRFMRFGKVGALLSTLILCYPSVPAAGAEAPATVAPARREPARLAMDLVVNSSRELRGSVLNKKSAGAAHAKVVLASAAGTAALEAFTDDAGSFLIKDVRPGVYTLSVNGPDGQTQRVARVWSTEMAPPAASPVALLTLQDEQPNTDIVRGLPPVGGGGAPLLVGGLIVAGITTAIVVPVVVSKNTSSALPASP